MIAAEGNRLEGPSPGHALADLGACWREETSWNVATRVDGAHTLEIRSLDGILVEHIGLRTPLHPNALKEVRSKTVEYGRDGRDGKHSALSHQPSFRSLTVDSL